MKKNCKTIISCIIFLCLLGTALFLTSKVLEDKNSVKKYAPFYRTSTNFDVIFMGTSHMYNGILPQELWAEYGITSYNWGYANSTLADDYYLMQAVLHRTRPKLFVVDLFGVIEYEQYGNGKYRDDSIEQQRVQFDSIPLSKVKYEAVADIFDNYDGRLDFLFNFLVYHNRWEELSKDDFKPALSVEKGAQLLDGISEGVDYFLPDAFEPVAIDSVCSGYISKIVDLCEKENVPVLFVYAPSPTYEEGINCSKTLETYMEQYEAAYLNSIYIDSINGTTDFYTDNGHLNYSGQKKFTTYLGNYIQQTYGLEDHRGDVKYASWNDDYKKYTDYKKETLINQEDINTKLMLAYGQDFKVDIKIEDGSPLYDNWALQMFIWNLGDNASVDFVDSLTIEDEHYQMLFTFYDKNTEEVFDVQKF